jgi:uncharacterized protein YggU (UPF0235/DUF167 family)
MRARGHGHLRATSKSMNHRDTARTCIDFFANLLKPLRTSVTIASGQTSRRKVFRVSGLSTEEIRRRIGM